MVVEATNGGLLCHPWGEEVGGGVPLLVRSMEALRNRCLKFERPWKSYSRTWILFKVPKYTILLIRCHR